MSTSGRVRVRTIFVGLKSSPTRALVVPMSFSLIGDFIPPSPFQFLGPSHRPIVTLSPSHPIYPYHIPSNIHISLLFLYIYHLSTSLNLYPTSVHPNPRYFSLFLSMEVPSNVDGLVSDLALRTANCSCEEFKIELPSLHSDSASPNLSIIGKILSSRNFYPSVVKDIADKAWNLTFPMLVNKVDRNIFLFTFTHEVDLNSVFRRRPWTLRGAHLILKVWNLELTWQEVDFSSSTFWIQVHGLPFLWQNKPSILKIGQHVGKVSEVDLIGEIQSRWHRFVRMRVEVDILSPLKPSMFLPKKNLNDAWIGFKYEKLSSLCYICGVLRHESASCNAERLLIKNPFGHKFAAYGSWLHTNNDDLPFGIYDLLPPTPTSHVGSMICLDSSPVANLSGSLVPTTFPVATSGLDRQNISQAGLPDRDKITTLSSLERTHLPLHPDIATKG